MPAQKKGFSLVEILIAVVFIASILVISLSASGGFNYIYKSHLEQVATQIASSEIERLRNMDFTGIQSGNITDSNLSKLPQGSATRTVTLVNGNSDIKEVIINVTWQRSGIPKSVQMGTIIYEYGI